MKWRNVKLIFSRELRDQLRDRRTLFTVAVMPMLLYPLMGMAMLQVGQFMREYPTKAWLIGVENLAATSRSRDGWGNQPGPAQRTRSRNAEYPAGGCPKTNN